MLQTTCVNSDQDHETTTERCTLNSVKMSIFITITMMKQFIKHSQSRPLYLCLCVCVYMQMRVFHSLSHTHTYSVDYLEYPSTDCPILFSEMFSRNFFSLALIICLLRLRCSCCVRTMSYLAHICNHFTEQMPSNRFYVLSDRMPLSATKWCTFA